MTKFNFEIQMFAVSHYPRLFFPYMLFLKYFEPYFFLTINLFYEGYFSKYVPKIPAKTNNNKITYQPYYILGRDRETY